MRPLKWITQSVLPVSLATLIFSQTAQAIPISAGFAPIGLVPGEIGVIGQEQHLSFVNSGKVPGADERLDIDVPALIGLYAPTNKTDVFIILPYVYKYLRGPAVNVAPSVNIPLSIARKGLGDPVVGGAYDFHQKEGFGWNWTSAVTVSLGLPLGSYDDPTVPRVVQPGTGDFTPTVGITSVYQSLNGNALINLSYSDPLKHNGYRAPRTFNYNLSLTHNIYPFLYQKGVKTPPLIMAGAIELLGTATSHADADNQVLNGANSNTGGNVINLAPGIQFQTKGFEVAFEYQIPIVQSLNGAQALKQSKTYVVQFVYITA